MKRLEVAGYIRVSVSTFARKSKSLHLTSAGHDAYARTHRRSEFVELFTRLTEQERIDLYRLLGLIGPPRLRECTAVG